MEEHIDCFDLPNTLFGSLRLTRADFRTPLAKGKAKKRVEITVTRRKTVRRRPTTKVRPHKKTKMTHTTDRCKISETDRKSCSETNQTLQEQTKPVHLDFYKKIVPLADSLLFSQSFEQTDKIGSYAIAVLLPFLRGEAK